jgi:protein tyrosine/serine phosphatase
MIMDVYKIMNWMSTHKRQLLIAIILLGLIGALCAWEGFAKDIFIPKKFGVVEPGQIYRSGKISPFLIRKILTKYGIKVIITLSGDSTSSSPDNAERKTAKELGIERLVFSMRGNGTGDIGDYAKAVAAIYQAQQENKPVLVHCAAGAHRTGGVIAAYRLIVQKKDVNFVRAEMIHYGFNPNHNTNLRVFLNDNMMAIAEKLKTMGVIEKVPSSIPAIEADQ